MIANKSTTVPPEKSVSEIQQMLVAARASAIMVDYEQGEPVSISFKIHRSNTTLSFQLPCNWQGTLAAMQRARLPKSMLIPSHAKRVAWRILRDWLRAQLSLIESGATTMEEVMLPWCLIAAGQTVASKMLTGPSPLLLEVKQ